MKRKKLRLSCLLLLVGAVNANAQESGFPSYDDGAVYVGDAAAAGDGGGTYVGDSYSSPRGKIQAESVGWAEQGASAPVVQDHAHGTYQAAVPQRTYQGSASHEVCGEIGSVLHGCNPKWLRAETLLWFPPSRGDSALVTANTGPGEPLETIYGDDIGGGLAPGFRLDFGHYFQGGKYGLGARVWGLYESNDNFSASSDGTTDLQRPFFNTALGTNDALIIGNTFGPPDFIGSVDAESKLDMIATEAYGRMMLGQGQNFHVDLIGGYSFFDIDDTLSIRSATTVATGTLFSDPTGTVRSFRDSYKTENQFHGGQIGMETILKRGRWSMLTLTKVHLGNMSQHVDISGSSSRAVPAVPTENFDNGFLVQGQQGHYERDEFTFVPEVNVKLAYMLRRNISLSVGYSFLYWDDLALASDQIDNRVDGTLLLSNDPNPVQQAFTIRDAGFWIQGIDLGVTIDF